MCCQLPVPQASRPDIDQAGAATRSPGDPLFDTSTSQGRLLVTMLAAIAEFERELIRERTGEGRARARACASAVNRSSQTSNAGPCPAAAPDNWRRSLARHAVSVSMISSCSGADMAKKRRLPRVQVAGPAAQGHCQLEKSG